MEKESSKKKDEDQTESTKASFFIELVAGQRSDRGVGDSAVEGYIFPWPAQTSRGKDSYAVQSEVAAKTDVQKYVPQIPQ